LLSERTKLVIILLVTLAYRATNNMLQTSVPLYAKYVLGQSDFTVSVIVALANISAILSLLYLGYSSMRVGKSIFLSLAFTCVCLPLFLVTWNVVSLALVNLFVTFWIGTLMPLLLATVVLVSGPLFRERNLTIFYAVLSLSLVLGPIYQGAVLAATNDNLISSMLCFAPLVAAAAVLFLPLLRSEGKLEVAGQKVGILFVRDPRYWMGILAFESFNLPFIAIATFGGIFAKNSYGASYGVIETLFTAFFFTSLIVRIILVRFPSRNEPIMLLSFLVMGIGLLMWAFSSSFWDLTLSLVLLGSAHGSTYPIATRHIADSVSREKTVGAFTVCLLIDDAVSLAGAPLLGLIAELFGLSSLFLTLEVPVLGIGLGYTVMMRRALTQNIGG